MKVHNNEEIPCDMVCISSVREDGDCHVTTANLDGETNLKVGLTYLLIEEGLILIFLSIPSIPIQDQS